MRYFLTKMWAFEPETAPFVGFAKEGSRAKFLREAKPTDWLVSAGTKGSQTRSADQGRLLGIAQVSHLPVDANDIIRELQLDVSADRLDDDGNYKWPYALPIVRAERFVGQPDLKDVFGSYLSGLDWAMYAIELEGRLGADAVGKLGRLERTPVQVAQSSSLTRLRIQNDVITGNATPTNTLSGPGPAERRSEVELNPNAPGFAYVFRLVGGKKEAYKIGYSGDHKRRLAELTAGLVPPLSGCHWQYVQHTSFHTLTHAYAFEQQVHRRLERYRVAATARSTRHA